MNVFLIQRSERLGPMFLPEITSNLINWRSLQQLAEIVDVFITQYTFHLLVPHILLKRMGLPLVFDLYDLLPLLHEDFIRKNLDDFFTPYTIRLSDHTVASSMYLYEYARRYRSSAELIPNGVDVADLGRFHGSGDDGSIVFVGDFGHWVDWELLLSAVGKLREVKFRLIGDGRLRQKVSLSAQERDFKNIEFTGFLPYDQCMKAIASASIGTIPFKLSPLTDAVCPLKLFEYWSLKKPVICTPTKELLRLASGAALFVISPREFADAVRRLLVDAALRSQLVERGYELACRHDWGCISNRYLSVLSRAVQKGA